MSFKKRTAAAVLVDADVDLPELGLGAKYARLCGFKARNWASSAKGGAGTDAALTVKITDNNGDVCYLDAADKDYKTAEVTKVIGIDDTTTGLGITAVDATGAGVTAGSGLQPVIEGPVTINVTNGATATDYFEISLFVEV